MDLESQTFRYIIVAIAYVGLAIVIGSIQYAKKLSAKTPKAKKGKNNLAVKAKSQQFHKEQRKT